MYGIIANVLRDRALRTGAKVWIVRCNGDAEHPIVIGLSKSGKMIEKYSAYKRLTNYRAAWIPEHLRDRICWVWNTKEEASERAQTLHNMWSQARYFSRDGSMIMKDGISTGAVFGAQVVHSLPRK